MRGHIRQRGRRSWSVVIDVGRGLNGKRRQKWHVVHGTRKDAERELARLLHLMHTGGYVEPDKMTVSEFLEHWLSDYAKDNVGGRTLQRYQGIVRQHLAPAFGGLRLVKLQPLHIQGHYSRALEKGRHDGKGGLSATTVLQHHRVLRCALQQAVRWNLLARNPADAAEPPRRTRGHLRALDEPDTARILAGLTGTRSYMPALLAASTGMRRGEILGLKWKDVDLEGRVLMVRRSLEQTSQGLALKSPKTHHGRRRIDLPTLLVEALRVHKALQAEQQLRAGPKYRDNGLVCPKPDGKPWPPDSFSTHFGRALRRAGLEPIRFHDLRHGHATHLLRQGIHPKIVSERLGHSTVGITLDTYSHVLPGMQAEAASKIDRILRAAMDSLVSG